MGSYLFFPEAPLLENHLAYWASDPENTFRVSVSTASYVVVAIRAEPTTLPFTAP